MASAGPFLRSLCDKSVAVGDGPSIPSAIQSNWIPIESATIRDARRRGLGTARSWQWKRQRSRDHRGHDPGHW
jgi:hypothetical protein